MSRQLGPSPPATSEAVSRSMKGNRGKNTSPEVELRRLLREAGLQGYRLHWAKAPGRPDIAYPGRRVAVFVNGCFWHRCPRCQPSLPKTNAEFWARKFELNRERDVRKVVALEAQGWAVVTVWECEIKSEPEKVIERVRAVASGPSRERAGTSHTNC